MSLVPVSAGQRRAFGGNDLMARSLLRADARLLLAQLHHLAVAAHLDAVQEGVSEE